jgi:hypothetical protein
VIVVRLVVILAIVPLGLLGSASRVVAGRWYSADVPVLIGPEAQGSSLSCAVPLRDGAWGQSEPQLEIEEADVGPPGTWGKPRLCVLHFPREDVRDAALIGIDNVEQFRAAKTEAIARLRARGVDTCHIAKWAVWGAQNQGGYTQEDRFGASAECTPVVVAGDPGAAAHLATVRDAFARAEDVVGTELGWRPNQPLRVIVLTEEAATVATYRRYHNLFVTEDRAEENARAGAPQYSWVGGAQFVYGHLGLVNLMDPNYRSATRIGEQAIAVYGFFALEAIYGGNPMVLTGENRVLPIWIDRGLRRRLVYRYTANGTNGGYLVEATRAVRAGVVSALGRLTTSDSTLAADGEYGTYALNARAYAAVMLLAEKYSPDALSQLLRESRGTSIGHVQELIAQLTGVPFEGFDQVVNDWLLGLRHVNATSDDGRIRVELMLLPDGRRGEALVDEAAAACVFDVADRDTASSPGLVGFSIALAADGSFRSARPSARIGNRVTLIGRLDDSGILTGTYQVQNEVTGCDSGPISFQTP